MAKSGQFTLSLQAFVEQTQRNADTVIREATFSLLNSILQRSPVDTGRFRGNWNVGVDTPNRATNDKIYPGGSPQARGAAAAADSLERAGAVLASFTSGEQIWLSNGLPYAIELEYGHSKQAPSGIVRVSILEYQQYLERAAASLSK